MEEKYTGWRAIQLHKLQLQKALLQEEKERDLKKRIENKT